MKTNFFCYALLACTTTLAHAVDYIFPLALQQESDHKLILVAHCTNKMRIYLWDPKTYVLTPALPTFYSPSNITKLFDGQGFSFFDKKHETIYLKKHSKQPPQSLMLKKRKLTEARAIKWLDNETCLMTAQCYHPKISQVGLLEPRQRTGIYHVACDGEIATILSSPSHDYLYPNITHNALFCIKRASSNKNHGNQQQDYLVQRRIEDSQEEELIPLKHTCYGINMLSREEGVYYGRSEKTKKHKIPGEPKQSDPFIGYHFRKEQHTWRTKELIIIHAPFMGAADPFNLFKPLVVQNGLKNTIFYITGPFLCAYDLASNEGEIILQEEGRFFCAPILSNEKIYCGCSLQKNDTRLWKNKKRQLCCDLPYYQLSYENQS